MASSLKTDAKPHVCPPSKATRPADRWESLFVYSFICKFTNLRHKVEGLESPMDLEEALLLQEPNNIVTQILGHFVVNLKPQTRNLSTDQISTTVATVLSEYFKSSERTIFWNEELNANEDPFAGLEGGFFTTSWDFKLKILRQLVELQLCHSPEIKATIDNAWGVVHNKHKKNQAPVVPPPPNDLKSQESLQLLPIGQDFQRKRYWVADDSPRVYASGNPWKMSVAFEAICSTKDEYLAVIEKLKASTPSKVKGRKEAKYQSAHQYLISALEERVGAIDVEIARVQRVRKKIEQKRLLLAQAEIRQTRTRRQTQRPDYVYGNDLDSEDDGGDEYRYQEDEQDVEYEQDYLNGSRRSRVVPAVGTRRSARTATTNGNGKREGSSDSALWRGERRSTRLGRSDAWPEDEPSRKRARTEETTSSAQSTDGQTETHNHNHAQTNGVRVKTSGAAALKPTEVAMEQIAGKKKSKFWVYAVEPAPEPDPSAPGPLSNAAASSDMDVDPPKGHTDRREDTPQTQSPGVASHSNPNVQTPSPMQS